LGAVAPAWSQGNPTPAPGVEAAPTGAGGPDAAIDILGDQVSQQYIQGDFAGALATLQKMAEGYKASNNLGSLGEIWNGIGLVQERLGDLDAALAAYQTALETYGQLISQDAARGKMGEARTLNNMGGVYTALNQPEAALGFLERSLVLFREVASQEDEAITLTNMGGLYGGLNRPSDGIKALQQALELYQQLDNSAGTIAALDRLGTLYAQMGALPESIRVLEQGAASAEAAADGASAAAFLSRLGELHRANNNSTAATAAYEKALGYVAGGNPAGANSPNPEGPSPGDLSALRLQILLDLAQLQSDTNNLTGAIDRYQEALGLLEGQDAPLEQGELLIQIASLYHEAGQLPEAQQTYDRALALVQPLDVPLAEGQLLRGLGAVALDQQDLNRASTLLEQALARQRQAQGTSPEDGLAQQQEIGRTLSLLGVLYQQQKNYDRALTTYQAALEAQTQGQDLVGMGEVLRNIAVVRLRQGQPAQAAEPLKQSLPGWEFLAFRTGVILEPLVEAYQMLQATLVASNQVEEALVRAEQQRSLPYRLEQAWQQGIQVQPPDSLTWAQIQQLSQGANRWLLFYDIGTALPEDFNANTAPLVPQLRIWMVAPSGEVAFQEQPLLTEGGAVATTEGLIALIEASQGEEGADRTAALEALQNLLITPIVPSLETLPPQSQVGVSLPPPFQGVPYDRLRLGDEALGDRYQVELAPALGGLGVAP